MTRAPQVIKRSYEDILSSWRLTVTYLNQASEDNLWGLLTYELKHRARLSYVLRIYGKASAARTERERNELAMAIGKSKLLRKG